MLLIACPWCGPRDQTEFTYGRDANTRHPLAVDGRDEDWMDYVYWRSNPKGQHSEFWQHTAGCRQWIKVRRDTLSHVIEAVEPAR